MNDDRDDKWLDGLISRAIDSKRPVFDAERWKQAHPEATDALSSLSDTNASEAAARRSAMWRTLAQSRLTQAAAAVVLLGLVIWALHGEEKQTVAKIVSGSVLVRSGNTADWTRQEAGQGLAAGDDLRVDKEIAVVELDDGTELTIGCGTVLVLTGERDDSRNGVHLRSGVVTAKVTKPTPGCGAFYVESSQGTVRTLGTEFTVRMADHILIEGRLAMRGVLPIATQIMAVTVITGAVELRADGKTALVEAGSSGIAVHGEVPLTGPAAEAVMHRLLVSSQVTGPMRPSLQTHDECLAALFGALGARRLGSAGSCAETIADLWQMVGRMTRHRSDPKYQARMDREIETLREKAGRVRLLKSRQLFLEHGEASMNWARGLRDDAWVDEIAHVFKQVEEYGEEVRNGGRMGEVEGLAYIEHCLPGFLTYCEWFKRLPWDDPSRQMTPAELLAGIERDLRIARRETQYAEIRQSPWRYPDRSMEQAQKNASKLLERLGEQGDANEARGKLCKALADRIDALMEGVSDLERRSYEQRAKTGESREAFRLALKEMTDDGKTVGDALVEQIDEALDTCAKLLEEVNPR